MELFEIGHNWITGAKMMNLLKDWKIVSEALALFFKLESRLSDEVEEPPS